MEDEYFCPLAGKCPAYLREGDAERIKSGQTDRVRRADDAYICDGLVKHGDHEQGCPETDLPDCLLIGILNELAKKGS